MPPITFTDVDFQRVDMVQENPLMITNEIESFTIKKVSQLRKFSSIKALQ